MLKNESLKIRQLIDGIDLECQDRVLDIGASVRPRSLGAQHVLDNLYKPMKIQNVDLTSLDMKSSPDVDIVADFCDPSVVEDLRHYQFRLILCLNVLEHVEDRSQFIRNLVNITTPGSFLLVSVPWQYPRHLDPIDNGFRPTPSDLSALFRPMTVVESHVTSDKVLATNLKNPLHLARFILRLFLPFYRPKGWLTTVHRIPWLFRTPKTSIVLFRG